MGLLSLLPLLWLLLCGLLWFLLSRLLDARRATGIALVLFCAALVLSRALTVHCFVYDVLNPQAAWYGCLVP